MTNAPGTGGRGTGGETDAESLFPSEGTFSTVVPLSQVSEEADAPEECAAGLRAEDYPAEDYPAEDYEEVTLVPARVSPARHAARGPLRAKGGGQSWLVTAAVLLLSVVAGAAAGAYLIGSQRIRQSPPANVAEASGEVAAEVTRPEPPASAPTHAPAEPVTGEASTEASDKREAAPAPKPTPAMPPDGTHESEPASRRASATEPRAERHARANAEAAETRPAPKLTRRAAAPPRETVAEKRAPAATERALPISSPPASARPKKVIQWP